jgi:quercetin dioxygenase-like cupin family protein
MTMMENKVRSVIHVEPGAGETLDVLGDIATFKVAGAMSGGSLILAEIVTQPGGGPPGLHAHPTEEAFYILEGEFEVSGLGEGGEPYTSRAVAGSVVYVPSGAAHNFRNVGATSGRLLVMYTSPELEMMARELSTIGSEMAPDPNQVMGVLVKHGIQFVGSAHV